ncbi:MAG: short-chain dehydrogenase/reductase [Frankiales bacterium]|nr:short-chain dehydrogenase/reductase [Frankiales bacterium]
MGLVVITGGSRGIGAATAIRAARAGWDVCLSYVSDEAAAAAVVAECERAGVRATAIHADIGDEADITGLFAAADRMGTVTGLVNNAGVVAVRSLVRDMSAARVARMFQVNTVGAILCAGEAVRRMTGGGGGGRGGAIVNVSSRAATIGSPGRYVDYAASKAALDTFTLGLAKEVAADGIRVNGVRPGIIDTDIHASGGEPDRAERLGPTIPLGRAGTAAEVANAVVWLLSDEASYVTGAMLDVGGGL